jgi:peptide chain release factor 1
VPLLQDPDPSLRSLAEEESVALQHELNSLVQDVLPPLLIPSSPTQDVSALVEIKAGAGGEEAGLFAGDLLRMYTRYVDLWGRDVSGRSDGNGGSGKGWKTDIISESFITIAGGRAAYKEVTLEVKGRGAYDTFRWETGVHRVQRVPATETTGRMHTSAVAVVVRIHPSVKQTYLNYALPALVFRSFPLPRTVQRVTLHCSRLMRRRSGWR